MMQQQRYLAIFLLVVGLLLNWTSAWAPMIQSVRHHSVVSTRRWAEEPAAAAADASDDKSNDASAADEATTAEGGEANLVSASAENAEVTAIKEKIAKLEEQLKQKHREIITVKDMAEEFSKVGYARKVAEMENMRRFRSQLQSSNEFSSTANVVTEFLPVLDELQRLKALYADDAFGKNYNAMAGNFQTALLELGVEEFTVPVGSPVDGRRVVVVDTEYSDKIAKNTVVRPLKLGLELKGNVVRLAECVASLGSEAEAKKAAAAEAAAAATEAPASDAADEKKES